MKVILYSMKVILYSDAYKTFNFLHSFGHLWNKFVLFIWKLSDQNYSF